LSKRKFRLRPRFFVFSVIVLAALSFAVASLFGSFKPSAKPPHTSHPAPLHTPLIVSTIKGSFNPASVNLPIPLTEFSVVATPPGAVALVGGYTKGRRINPIVYTLTNTGVVADGRMISPHANGNTIDLSGRVQYVGGIDAVDKPSSRIQPVSLNGSLSDPPNQWLRTPLSAMATASAGATAYVVGGQTAKASTDIIYRIRLGSHPKPWSRLPEALSHPMAAVYRGMLWVIGGYSEAGGYSSAVYTVNLQSGQVTAVAQLPLGLANGAITEYHHDLWILGGSTPSGETADTFVILPSGSAIHPGPKLPQAVQADSAFVLDGRLWVGGGTTANGSPIAQLWQYRPQVKPAPRQPDKKKTATAPGSVARRPR
jgi:hypothetical protein